MQQQVTFGKFDLANYKNCLVVTDNHIAKLYNITGENVYLLPRGEVAKSFDNVQLLCKWFLQNNLQRSGKVVAVGGGSIGDTVGFACSIFKRGVQLLHVPTTLVAQIDSAIGGKTAVDFCDVKNAIGTFYPAETLVDFTFLNTLDEVQKTNGSGELLKYRMLDADVDYFVRNDMLNLAMRSCISYKTRLCQIDPFDNGERHKLNFGHTIGHAMELTLGIPHGLAVLNGIYFETELAKKLELCTQQYADFWQSEVQKLCNVAPCLTPSMLDLTLTDKKNNGDDVCFVLPDTFKEVFVPLERVKQLLLP